MPRVLLINTNTETSPIPVLPYGLCLLTSELRSKGIEVKLLDLCFESDESKALADSIKDFKPHIIGLSLRNIDNSSFISPRFYLEGLKERVDLIKGLSTATVILGGPAFSIAPDDVLEYFGVDWGVVGDGEGVLYDFIMRHYNGDDLSSISGLVRRIDGRIERNLKRESPLSQTVVVNLYGDVKTKKYLSYGAFPQVQTKRGCPMECIYCTYNEVEGMTLRLKDPEVVAEEVEILWKTLRPSYIEFVDSTFNLPEEHAIDVCDAIVKKGVRPSLYTTGLNPKGVSEPLIEAMKEAGFGAVVCSPDTASRKVLKSLQKGFSIDDIILTRDLLKRARISTLWSFIFGGPGESEETVKETLRFIRAVIGRDDPVMITIGLRVYPGTELEALIIKEGLIERGEGLLKPFFYLSKGLSLKRFEELIREEGRGLNIFPLYNLQNPLIPIVARVFKYLGLKGPLWRYNRGIGRFINILRHRKL